MSMFEQIAEQAKHTKRGQDMPRRDSEETEEMTGDS
jgi:hypothetical protein